MFVFTSTLIKHKVITAICVVQLVSNHIHMPAQQEFNYTNNHIMHTRLTTAYHKEQRQHEILIGDTICYL